MRLAMNLGVALAAVTAAASVAVCVVQMFWHDRFPGGQGAYTVIWFTLMGAAALALVLSLLGLNTDRPRAALGAILALVALLFLFATPVYG